MFDDGMESMQKVLLMFLNVNSFFNSHMHGLLPPIL